MRRALAAVFTLCTLPAFAQHHDMASMSSATRPLQPPSALPPAFPMQGIGNSHLHVTATPAAQQWFDQGLNLYHDFWDYEAARAFQQGIRADPNCAMCFWGLHQALLFRSSSSDVFAGQALDSALALRKHVSRHERLYLDAAAAARDAAKASHGSDGHPDTSAEVALWRKAVAQAPHDLQARIFLAGALHDGYDDDAKPRAGTAESIAILTQVLALAPTDSAANHYWIHAMEPTRTPGRALASAQSLAALAPASGHMVHMPGHIFYRVGDYATAEHWFAASTAVDEAYLHTHHIAVDNDWNYVHNLMYAIDNLMEEGKLAQAATLSHKLPDARGQLAETLYLYNPRDAYSRLNPQLPVALRTGDWTQVLALLLPSSAQKQPESLPNLAFAAADLRHFATGMAALERPTPDLAAAQSASDSLDAALWRTTQSLDSQPHPTPDAPASPPKQDAPTVALNPDAMARPLLDNLAIMSLELRAALAAARHDLPATTSLFAQAAHLETQLGYREPPGYIRPVGETEGLILLRAGDPAAAHEAFARVLVQRPNSGFSLYGLALASEQAHNAAAARTEYTAFLKAWSAADSTLPQLAHARAFTSAASTAQLQP